MGKLVYYFDLPVAEIRDSLPVQERAHAGVLAGNYGEAGAIDLFGPGYGLPQAGQRCNILDGGARGGKFFGYGPL